MSGFSAAAAVDRLDYDFTGAPRADGNGMCTGKGVIPEPSVERIEALFAAYAKIADETTEAGFPELRSALAEFCNGTPSLAELEELPYRVLLAFVKWLLGEVADPKGSKSATS